MRRIALLCWMGLAVAPGAAAQTVPITMDPFAGSEGGDTVRPITSYPLGQSELVATTMLRSLRMEQRQRDLCWEYGCLVIANESTSYRITAFHVQEAAADGTVRWGRNQFKQFGVPLYPKKATFLFKTGSAETCDWPVMFILKDVKRRDTIQVEGRASLCTNPHHNSLVRVRVVYPSVTVGGS